MINRVKIGKIIAPHGVKGEFRIIPLTDFPDRFKTLTDAFLADGRPVIVESARPHKQFFLLKLKGFDTPEAVAPLCNMTLEVDRDAVAPLPPGHYYVFDLVGMHVFTETGEALGVISDVLETGSNDVYVVDQKQEGNSGKARLGQAFGDEASHGSPYADRKVALPGGKKSPQLLIPALKSVVLEINVPDKKMVVRLPEGLI